MKRGRLFLFGSFLAVFLMVMVPSIGAVEYSLVEDTIKEDILPRFKVIQEPLQNKKITQTILTPLEEILTKTLPFSISGWILWIIGFIIGFIIGLLWAHHQPEI